MTVSTAYTVVCQCCFSLPPLSASFVVLAGCDFAWTFGQNMQQTTHMALARLGADYIQYITVKEHVQESDEDNGVCKCMCACVCVRCVGGWCRGNV